MSKTLVGQYHVYTNLIERIWLTSCVTHKIVADNIWIHCREREREREEGGRNTYIISYTNKTTDLDWTALE